MVNSLIPYDMKDRFQIAAAATLIPPRVPKLTQLPAFATQLAARLGKRRLFCAWRRPTRTFEGMLRTEMKKRRNRH